MKSIAILQSNYIPWKGYFDLIRSVDTFVIYDEVQYTKNDWRNRNQIKTANGPAWLTIPVRQLSLSQKIYETEVSLPNWNAKHWNTLKTNYAKAKHFGTYGPLFEHIYKNISTPFLSEINLTFIKAINEILNIKTEIIDSRELQLEGDRNERLLDAVKKLNGTRYISGPSAKSYLDESLFNNEGISVDWISYAGYPEYEQLFPPFVHAVSVLDLIFNMGPDAHLYLDKK